MNVSCSNTGTYQQAMSLIRAINSLDCRFVDGQDKFEANITVGGVSIWLENPSFLPQVEAVCRQHGARVQAGATESMENVILRDPQNFDQYAEKCSSDQSILKEWLL
jgi:hypothetical protein